MINVQEINPIDAEKWLSDFIETDLYKKIEPKYKHTISTYREMTLLKAALNNTVYETPRNFCEDKLIFDVVPYYYIQWLIATQPKKIVDLGCGLNIFKKAWPDIIGIDPDKNSHADINDYFDQEFAAGHQNYCDALISINAIHFSSIDTITERVLWCAKMLQPGGRAFISFNLETWLMYTDQQKVLKLFGSTPKFCDIINYVDQQIKSTKLDFLVYDWPVVHTTNESSIRDDLNGNIRLVFQHD